jgi:3-phenylpropionate/trans-cinnamate dioxygenase ferredoxin reductase subunit
MADAAIVIVGGGRAAASLVEAYRAAGGEDFLTVISEDTEPPYNRPPLSKGFLRGEIGRDEVLAHPTAFYEANVVEVRLGERVDRVDPARRVVLLAGGEEVSYTKLVIASGARPRPLTLPGADLPDVHTYRTLADATAVRDLAADAKKALIVGGSFIGSEVAASLRLRGLEVTIVELGERLMPALASDALSTQLVELYRDRGVEVLLGESIAELTANGRSLTGAVTGSGRRIEAFLVVVGVGVEANVTFLEGAGIELDDGVVVDERFRSSLPGVYAVGDVARYPDPVAGRTRRIEHWSAADAQGAYLGRQLAGARAVYAEVPVFFTQLFDLKLQVMGDIEGTDEVVLRGSVGEGRLLGFYLREGRLSGVVLAGQNADVAEELRQLVREGPDAPERALLANETVRPAAAFAGALS